MLRKDNWTKENDMLLAEIVIHNIKCGNTQLAGFEEAGQQLNRTSAACGFRWNKELRPLYEAEIKQAKMERADNKEKKQTPITVQIDDLPHDNLEIKKHPLLQIVSIVQDYIQRDNTPNITQQAEIDYLRQVVSERDQTVATLQERLQEANDTVITLKDDYAALLKILSHARKMGIVDDIAKIG